MRKFEYARGIEDGKVVSEKAFKLAKLPEYSTSLSAGADFFAAEDVKIPSIWKAVKGMFDTDGSGATLNEFRPTLVHTGVKASMYEDEVLRIYNRSSGPKKGLVMANSVGIIDADYYNNPNNDGEIMFAFYNFLPIDIVISAGDRIGQGIFEEYLRPEEGLIVADKERSGGFGSTGTT